MAIVATLANRVKVTCNTVGTGTLTLGAQFAGFRDFYTAGIPDNSFINYVIEDGNNWEVGQGNYTFVSSAPNTCTLTRAIVTASSSGASVPISLSGASTVAIAPTLENILPLNGITPGGRLTGINNTPVMSGYSVSSSTIYYTPYLSNTIPVWDGLRWVPYQFSQTSQLVTDTTKSPAATVSFTCYDMFGWLDRTVAGQQVFRVTRGPNWQNYNSRGTGTALVRNSQIGLLVSQNAITNGPAAQQGIYLGTIVTNSTGALTWFGGGGAAGGVEANISVWNMYNRIDQHFSVTDTTGSHASSGTGPRMYNGSVAMRLNFVVGLTEDALYLTVAGHHQPSPGAVVKIGIGFNIANNINVGATATFSSGATTVHLEKEIMIRLAESGALGSLYIQMMEQASAATTFIDTASETVLMGHYRA